MKRPRIANRTTVSVALLTALAAAGCVSEADGDSVGDDGDSSPDVSADLADIDVDAGDIELDLDVDDNEIDEIQNDEIDPGDASLGAAAGAELTDDETDCLDRGAVDALGTDRFIEVSRAGEIGVDLVLEPAEADAVADVFFDCVDASDFLRRTFAADPAFAQLPTEFVDCILGEIDDDVLRTGLSATFSGADATGAAIEQAGAEAGFACIEVLTPEQLEDLADLGS